MKKSQLKNFEPGSAHHVVAHAAYQRTRGRRPSMAYAGENNPLKALTMAGEVISLSDKPRQITKEEYRELFSRLPINNPTARDMAMMCPHLSPEEAVMTFGSGPGSVALPPLRIRNGFQIVRFYNGFTEQKWHWKGDEKVIDGGKKHPARLSYTYAERAGETRYRAMNRAMAYAKKYWGGDLILDNWKSYVTVYIQDPSNLHDTKYRTRQPTTTHALHLFLDKELSAVTNDFSLPESERYERHIAQMTLDPVIAHELKGDLGSYIHYNCAHCGSGLSLFDCSGCGHTFDDNGIRTGWTTPLSFSQVRILEEQGHVFKKDPHQAWVRERTKHREAIKEAAEWEKKRETAA